MQCVIYYGIFLLFAVGVFCPVSSFEFYALGFRQL